MEIVLTSENFKEEVENGKVPVLVDFWASWCGPCKMLSPVVEEIAAEFDGKIKVGKLNVDDETEIAIKFGVESIPTLILFKDGKEVKRTVGYLKKEEVIENFGLEK